MKFRFDTTVQFPCLFVGTSRDRKGDQRRFVAEYAKSWLTLRHAQGARGPIVFDIDDTLIDGNESVRGGFEAMLDLFRFATRCFPVHIVTARPDSDHDFVVALLHKKNIDVPYDRLHMLPAHLYGQGNHHVEDFKWGKHVQITKLHGCPAVARMGDKLWDVAHRDSLSTYMSHVKDRDTCIFFDPMLDGALSVKLPGM